jgi:F-box interacting protein
MPTELPTEYFCQYIPTDLETELCPSVIITDGIFPSVIPLLFSGFLVVSGGEFRNVIHVCNPILCEHIEIHVDDHKTCLYGNYFALGCSATGNQYKVLWTFYQNDRHRYPKAEIYTIKTGHWRSVGNGFSIGRLDFNTSLHGCIHWAHYETSWECICSFDFESEQFKRLPAPPICDGNLDGFIRLGVLKDCLSVTVRKWDAPYEIHVWVMNEYGVQESWSKQILFKPDYHHFISYEPLILLRRGKILILLDGELVVCYNIEKIRSWGRIINCENMEDTHAIAYNPSFVSLHHIAAGEEQVLR